MHDKAAKKPTGTGRGRKKKEPAAESPGEPEQQELF